MFHQNFLYVCSLHLLVILLLCFFLFSFFFQLPWSYWNRAPTAILDRLSTSLAAKGFRLKSLRRLRRRYALIMMKRTWAIALTLPRCNYGLRKHARCLFLLRRLWYIKHKIWNCLRSENFFFLFFFFFAESETPLTSSVGLRWLERDSVWAKTIEFDVLNKW